MGQQKSKVQQQNQFNLLNAKEKFLYKYEIPLESFKEFQCEKNHMISSITANSKLTIFQKTQQVPKNIGSLIAINTQLVYKQKKNTDFQAISKIIKYYETRKKLNQDNEIDDNIIKLFTFQAQNNKNKNKIYPQANNQEKIKQNVQANKENRFGSMCSFDLFNSKQSLQKTKNIIDRKGCYQFKFMYQFYLNNLQKEIQLRAQNKFLFQQKQIWSLLWCCISVAQKMIRFGLKQPMLSPASIFISQQSLIKVGQWEFSSYYVHNKNYQQQLEVQEGQTILNLNLQQQEIKCDSSDSKNILMKYYWAPQGLIQMQKVISLGQTTKLQINQKQQRKNSQIFSLGMTIIQMCTLQSNYQKSTFSQKQLAKIINKTIENRQKSGQALSDEMITLIRKMLCWDFQERITYEDALQYIQAYFNQHNSIFQEQDSNYAQKSQRNNVKISTQQFQSMFTQQSIINLNPKDKIAIEQNEEQQNILNYAYEQKASIGTTHLNLNGSGLINQGEGDTFLPEQNQILQTCETDQNYAIYQFHQQKSGGSILTNNKLFPLAPDFPDFQNFNDIGLQQTYQHNKYDEDQDQYLRNSKHQTQFQITQSNNYLNIQDQGSRIKYKVFKSYNEFDYQNIMKSQRQNDLNSKYTQKNSNLVDDFRNNQKINNNSSSENFTEYYSNKFDNTFNKNKDIPIKMTYSPALSNVGSQQYSSIPINNHKQNKQSIFTDPSLMAMIKQYSSRKIPNNQYQEPKSTPKQDYNQILINKNSNLCEKQKIQTSTSLSSLSKKFDISQKYQQKVNVNQVNFVKEEFSRGFYEGSKKNGMRNGYGTFYYNQGGKYSGYWLDNQMQGHGTLYYPDGRIAYQGQWHKDSLHGKGILHNQKPVQMKYQYDYNSFIQCESEEYWVYYDGWFQNDQKTGFGQLLLSNGEKYVGEFKNDMIHGKGKFYVLGGQVIQGYWQFNQLVQILSQNSY